MKHVFYTIDNLRQATLAGGMFRYMTYAPLFHEHGYQANYFTMESDLEEDFMAQRKMNVRVVPVDASAPLQLRREALLQASFGEATKLPPGQSIAATDSCGLSWNMMQMVHAARKRGTAIIYNSSMMPGPLPASFLSNLALRVMGHLCYRQHSLVIPQTHAIERFFLRYFQLPRRKVRVIGNGVNCSRFAPATPEEKAAARRRLGLPEDALIMLNVGSVVPRKGTHRIIEAWAQTMQRFPQARLVIAGTLGRRATFGDQTHVLDSYAAQISSLQQQLPDPASVVLTGRQIDNVEEYHRAADAFVFASEREGLPNAVLEAMASGLPCVVAPYAGFPRDGEELGSAGTHYIQCGHAPESLAMGMAALLEDGSKRRSIGNAARELMLATQEIGLVLQQWIQAFESLTAS